MDELARERVAARADVLLALVSAVRLARPDTSRQLAVVAADHRAHAAALRPAPVAPSQSASAATAPAPNVTPTVTAPKITAPKVTARTAIGVLTAAERAGAGTALADLEAVGPATARLLASVAACRRVHVEVLSAVPATASRHP